MKEKLIKDIEAKYGENVTATEMVEFCFGNAVITPTTLRNYQIIRYIEERPEDQSKRSAMLDLEIDGAHGAACGLKYDTIKKIYSKG